MPCCVFQMQIYAPLRKQMQIYAPLPSTAQPDAVTYSARPVPAGALPTSMPIRAAGALLGSEWGGPRPPTHPAPRARARARWETGRPSSQARGKIPAPPPCTRRHWSRRAHSGGRAVRWVSIYNSIEINLGGKITKSRSIARGVSPLA